MTDSPTLKRSAQRVELDEENPFYQEAMPKIYEACWKFDRGKDGDLLKTLENKELPKNLFRQILRSGMNCKLTEEELEAVMPLFDNNGFVDGCEFILLFCRLRYEHSSKLLTERIQKEKRIRNAQKQKQEKLKIELEQKNLITLTDSYTAKDLESATKLMMKAAYKYDRLMPGAVQLDAFECEFMQANVFREQLKLVFNVQLSIPELSAFIRNFNKDNDLGDKINCAAFLVQFFRWGFSERSRRLHEIWAEKKRVEEEKEKKRLKEQQELERKNALKTSLDFTDEDKERAIVKLREAAKLYDKTTPGAMSMKAFEVKEMAPHVFKEQLRRIFNLQVTPPEMGALMAVFDVNGDGVITCEEFSKVFLNMGFEEREKELKAAIKKQKRAEKARIEAEKRKQEQLASKNALKVNYVYSEEEFQSAIDKLTEAAWRYDKTMPSAQCLDAFDSQFMEAHVLKEQLKKTFLMTVSPQELGAIMHYFDPEAKGYIECAPFLKKFFKTGFEERQRRKKEWKDMEKRIDQQKKKEEIKKKQEQDNKLAYAHIDHTAYTEEDFQSAFSKLTEGAIKYDRSGPGAVGLEGFEVISMPPHVFREQLKMVFNVKLSIPELMALMSYFDKEKTGTINCKQFVTQFLRTGFEERTRIRTGWRVEQKKRQERVAKKIEEKEKKEIEKQFNEVDFEFTEDDFDEALKKLVHLCYNFDQRQLGPAGLSAFECESLNPAQFREMLKRTFNVKLNPQELGALVTYFDSKSRKMVTCSLFLNSLVQIRVTCEEFRGKKGEARKIRNYVQELKDSYKQRMQNHPSLDAKPWRQNQAPNSRVGSAKIYKRGAKKAKPTNPLEKYNLRFSVGKHTGRMDLSGPRVWTDDHQLAEQNEKQKQQMKKNSKKHLKPELDDHNPFQKQDQAKKDALKAASDAELAAEIEEEQASLQESFKSNSIKEAEPSEAEPSNDDQDNNAGSHTEDPNELVEEEDHGYVMKSSWDYVDGDDDEVEGSLGTDKEDAEGDKPEDNGNEEEKVQDNLGEIQALIRVNEFKLYSIPMDVMKLADLAELWLDNNFISEVPPEIAGMKNLKLLSLTNNYLENLPPEICQLENLRSLFLRNNKLDSVPNLLGNLKLLRELDLGYNDLDSFPKVVTDLPRLIHLDLSYNQISELPMEMTQMKSLVFLNLEDNPINEKPAVLRKIPWLEVQGCKLPSSDRSSQPFEISPGEEFELLGMLKNRAANALTSKLRHKKKRYTLTS